MAFSRVAFLLDSFKRGGAQKMMAFVINCVADRYEKVYLLLEDDTSISYDLPSNAEVIRICAKQKTSGFISKLLNIKKKINSLKSIINEEKINLVCSFGCYYTLLAVLSTNKKTTCVIGSERRSPEDLGFVWKRLSLFAYKKCDRVVFQLNKARDFYGKRIRNKSFVIPNPFLGSDNIFHNDHKDYSIVVAAARLEYVKGIDVAIKSLPLILKEIPQAVLKIYGSGDFEKEYGNLVDSLSVRGSISYQGLSSTIVEDISNCSVFVLPSRYEGIPNMLLEALGAGIPCVASDCRPGGPRLLIGNNERGLLFENENYKELADCVLRILKDNTFALRLSKEALRVRDIFSPQLIRNQWVNCFVDTENDH